MGPGADAYVTNAAWDAIEKAGVIVAHKSWLRPERFSGKRIFEITHNYGAACDYIEKQRKRHTVAVLVSGDTGLFSFANNVMRRLHKGEYTVIPGISSVQMACARLGLSWEDMYCASVHVRTQHGLADIVREHKKVCILNGPDENPQAVAKYLYGRGIRRRTVCVAQNLSYDDEEIFETTLRELKDMDKEWKRVCLMIVIK